MWNEYRLPQAPFWHFWGFGHRWTRCSEVPQPGAHPHEEAGSHPRAQGLLRSAAGEGHDRGGEPLFPEGAALPDQSDGPPGYPAGLQPRGNGERASDPRQGKGVSLQVSTEVVNLCMQNVQQFCCVLSCFLSVLLSYNYAGMFVFITAWLPAIVSFTFCSSDV